MIRIILALILCISPVLASEVASFTAYVPKDLAISACDVRRANYPGYELQVSCLASKSRSINQDLVSLFATYSLNMFAPNSIIKVEYEYAETDHMYIKRNK